MELIKIQESKINGEDVNSANLRDIYMELGISKDFSSWAKNQIDRLNLIENKHYVKLTLKGEQKIEYIVDLDTAKNICLVSFSDRGQKIRDYFIEVEKKANKPLSFEEMAKQTILLADKRIRELENKIESDKPKVLIANTLLSSENTLDVEMFAKALFDESGVNLGRNKLFKWFRDNGFLNDKNRPYQQFIDRGYFKLKEGTYINQATNEPQIYFQLRITTKGQMYFANRLIDEVQK